MGTVIRFPDEKRIGWNAGAHAQSEPGSVIILPVIRIERHADDTSGGLAPGAGTPQGGGRRRPGRRS
jgi:hypothetical protein